MPDLVVHNQANLDGVSLKALTQRVSAHITLEKLIASGLDVTDIRAADEFSLDALVPVENDQWLVYHLT
jgi:hypothetical protein